MNYKNILQEYCQKNNIDLPVYGSTSSGTSHKPIWVSRVQVANEVYQSCGYTTRKQSEKAVAEYAYNNIISTPSSHKYVMTNSIILVDLENIQPIFQYPVDANIHYFISSYSTVAHEHLNGKVHIIDSSGSDAADHYMTFMAAVLSAEHPDKNMVIVSRDKFSAVLAQILQKHKIATTHVKTASDLIKLFELC